MRGIGHHHSRVEGGERHKKNIGNIDMCECVREQHSRSQNIYRESILGVISNTYSVAETICY